jgi:DNA modification methylase
MKAEFICGDAVTELKKLPEKSVQCVVTSPPYWGLRDYGHAGQIGLERTPADYVDAMVQVFREVRRVLKDDGTLWLNLGDSYAGGKGQSGQGNAEQQAERAARGESINQAHHQIAGKKKTRPTDDRASLRDAGLKPKDLVGIPWMVAFALRADGWYLRSEITWCKKVPMPESVADRPTSATEKIFLLTKSPRYYYDQDAIRVPLTMNRWSMSNKLGSSGKNCKTQDAAPGQSANSFQRTGHSGYYRADGTAAFNEKGRNAWNYWLLNPEPCSEAHFAVYPSEIPRRAILAGSKPGDVILDPFGGSGTTGMVAIELGRQAIGIELNPKYVELGKQRCNVTPGLPL